MPNHFILNNKSNNKFRLFSKDGAGFTIVEIIIAIALLLLGVIVVYGAFFAIVISTFNLSSRYTALYLAQEGLEVVRNIRDNNFFGGVVPWSTGFTGSPCNTGCIVDYKTETNQLETYNNNFLGLDNNSFYSNDGSTPTIFKRKITISPVAGTSDIIYIKVEVFWNYNGQVFTFMTGEYLYNWY